MAFPELFRKWVHADGRISCRPPKIYSKRVLAFPDPTQARLTNRGWNKEGTMRKRRKRSETETKSLEGKPNRLNFKCRHPRSII